MLRTAWGKAGQGVREVPSSLQRWLCAGFLHRVLAVPFLPDPLLRERLYETPAAIAVPATKRSLPSSVSLQPHRDAGALLP